MNFLTVRASLLKSTTTGLYPNRGVSAPRRARGRGRGAETARAAGAGEGEGRDVGLTSGGSLKRLSRKRPRLNSISRAEPLATVTRLRWFRENMLTAPHLHLLGAFPEPLGCVWSRPLLSLDARPPVRPGISPQPGSQTPPPETTPGPGRARHPPSPPPPKARPARPVPRRQAGPARQPNSQAPYTSRALRGRTIRSRPSLRRLTWARGGPREAPPHQPPPPGKPHSLRAENPLATEIAAWHTAVLAGPWDRAQLHP